MKINQIAAQIYTVRDHLGTPGQIASTLKQVRKIGYTAVELAGMGPVETADLAKMLADQGLTCCSSHENGETLLNSPEAVAEKLKMLGCSHTAYPYPANVDLSSVRAVRQFARGLNASGKVLQEAGILLSYHNHDIEFVKVKGTTILEIILEETDPKLVGVELDVHWVQAGGASPERWCRMLDGRIPTLHIKDFAVTPERKRVFCEIGSGNMDWVAIIAAAEESGTSWFIVEQDADWVDNDPFKSLKRSFQYISKELVS